MIVELTVVGQVDALVDLAFQIGEVVLNAAGQTSRTTLAKVLNVLVDGLVVQCAHDCEHSYRQEQKSNEPLGALQSHVSRKVLFLEAIIMN